MRSFEFDDGKSKKFWNIELADNTFTVTFGRVGTSGRTQTKEFPDAAKAQKEHDKLVAEKLKKGYVETTAGAVVGVPTLKALENAIRANPDDVAAHGAYADALMEAGDPRGDFIAVQLALEDETLTPAERKKLREREKELLTKHEKDWRGEWVSLVGGGGESDDGLPFPGPTYRFIRGIVAEATIEEVTLDCSRAFIRSPETAMIRRLSIGGWAFEEDFYEDDNDIPDTDDARTFPSRYVLDRWPHFGNLRYFQLGWTTNENYRTGSRVARCHIDGDFVHERVKRMPHLQELYLFAHRVNGSKLFAMSMPELRVLQVYHSYDYALEKLAKNTSLGSLTHLLFHPHALDQDVAYIRLPGLRALLKSKCLPNLKHLRLRLADFGDEGCQEIVTSGILERLETLDLRHGQIGNEGAFALASCPATKRLKMLDVSRNSIGSEGVTALNSAGINLNAQDQYDPSQQRWDNEYLFAGDIE